MVSLMFGRMESRDPRAAAFPGGPLLGYLPSRRMEHRNPCALASFGGLLSVYPTSGCMGSRDPRALASRGGPWLGYPTFCRVEWQSSGSTAFRYLCDGISWRGNDSAEILRRTSSSGVFAKSSVPGNGHEAVWETGSGVSSMGTGQSLTQNRRLRSSGVLHRRKHGHIQTYRDTHRQNTHTHTRIHVAGKKPRPRTKPVTFASYYRGLPTKQLGKTRDFTSSIRRYPPHR